MERPEDQAEEFLSDEEAANLDQAAIEREVNLASRPARRTEADPSGNVDRGVEESLRTTVKRSLQELSRAINGDAERQERCESFGLGSLALPDEFICPITMDKMRGVPPPPLPPPHRSRTAAARVPRLKK